MPEFTAVTAALAALMLVLGVILGWILRADRCAREKIAVNAGWQQQIESQQTEHDRLAKQNKSLMEQINQYQASIKDSAMRAKELSDSLKETFQRRDDLQRQLKEIRSNLDVTVAQRDRLQEDLRSKSAKDEANDESNRKKDEKIQRLNAELANWQSRVPPLVDRYRTRDEEARELEAELEELKADRDRMRNDLDKARDHLQSALARVAALESMAGSEQTRIEPVNAGTLPGGLDASNEPHDDTMENEITGLRDQIDADAVVGTDWNEQNDVADLPLVGSDEDGPWARVTASQDDNDADVDADELALDSLDSSVDQDLPPYIAPPGEQLASEHADATDLPADTDEPGLANDSDEAAAIADTNETDLPTYTDVKENSNDDLRQIKGIGPSIEKTLHELGFRRFRQIAEMTEYDIDRVARQLKGFRSRIYREDWIGQARMLQQQKNSNHT